MSKELAMAQMREVLERKNQQVSQKGFSQSFQEADFQAPFNDQDLIPQRRDQIAPNHLWGKRPTQHFKK